MGSTSSGGRMPEQPSRARLQRTENRRGRWRAPGERRTEGALCAPGERSVQARSDKPSTATENGEQNARQARDGAVSVQIFAGAERCTRGARKFMTSLGGWPVAPEGRSVAVEGLRLRRCTLCSPFSVLCEVRGTPLTSRRGRLGRGGGRLRGTCRGSRRRGRSGR